MPNMKRVWNKLSLRRKLLVMTFCIIILTGSTIVFSMIVMNMILDDYESNMYQSSICYELQKAIQEETRTFLVYTREPSAQNKIEMQEAFTNTQKCIDELPFEYEEIGKERYAITWSIRNGYEGYKTYRDNILITSNKNPEYVDELYKVFDMQEDLANYSLRLVEATLEQSNSEYEVREPFFKVIPVVWFAVLLISLSLFALLFHGFVKDLVDPLILMAENSRKMAMRDFQTPDFQTDREDEVGELVHAFNKMKLSTANYIHAMERLHEEEMKNLEKEKRLEGARLEILKSQVNPHFLFNTLNMISCMARIEEADVTDKMIISMSNLFRYNLRTVEQEVYLEQELEVLDDYIYIQQMRFDNRIEYQKLIEVDEYDVKIPSFTLQPIVENAFIHGLSSQELGGRIELRVWMEDMNLMLSIADSGCGMSEERLEEIRQRLCEHEDFGRGIGLGNISRRIHMLYENGKFEIESQLEIGTTVKITIPQKAVKGEVEHV